MYKEFCFSCKHKNHVNSNILLVNDFFRQTTALQKTKKCCMVLSLNSLYKNGHILKFIFLGILSVKLSTDQDFFKNMVDLAFRIILFIVSFISNSMIILYSSLRTANPRDSFHYLYGLKITNTKHKFIRKSVSHHFYFVVVVGLAFATQYVIVCI